MEPTYPPKSNSISETKTTSILISGIHVSLTFNSVIIAIQLQRQRYFQNILNLGKLKIYKFARKK